MQATQVTDFLQNFGLLPEFVRPDSKGNLRIPCIDQCVNQGKDKKPNLSINAVSGSFQCFRCGYAGEFKKLKRRFEPPTVEERALAGAQAYFSEQLRNENHAHVLQSLCERGFNTDFLFERGIGYAPKGYSQCIIGADVTIETLVKVGLMFGAVDKNTGETKIVETFNNRITIPYFQSDGTLYTFKARCRMDDYDNNRKYVALAGTTFTGPYNERTLNIRQGEVIVCEGEFDALTLIQYGFNAVGLPGAGTFQPSWFKDVSVTFIFDNDEAGHKGLLKATQAISECKALFLPEGTDVNSFVAERGIDAFKQLLANAIPYVEGKPQESDHLGQRLAAFDDWTHTNGSMVGAETGFSTLTKAIDGWQSGLIVFPAGANIGKSSFLLQCADQAVECNDDVIVGVASLDDSERTTFTKLIAYKANITYAQASKPRSELASSTDLMKNRPDLLKRRNDAFARYGELSHRLIIRDVRFGRSLKSFEMWVSGLRRKFGEKRIIIFVDSFDKMTMQDGAIQNTDSKGGLIQEVKRITTEQNVLVITSAEVRKIGEKRPTLSDIKDTTQIEYECDVAISLYQAYHHDQNTPIHYIDENGKKQPILEAWVLKNKMSGFKGGPLLFYFAADKSRFEQIPQSEREQFRLLVLEDIRNKSKGSRS